jgi:hypothetical protein
MSPGEKTDRWIADLAAKLREDIAAAEEQERIVAEERARAEMPPGRATMALLSVCIDRAYTALEAGFARIARLVDENVPGGPEWHRALLHQMTLPIQDRRPAVLSRETAELLDRLRRHRHWLRHAYAASFEWTAMQEATIALAPAVSAARRDLEQFTAFLGQE